MALATREPVTATLDQGLVTPPQCMAVTKQIIEPAARRLPVKSIWKSFSRILAELNSLLAVVVRKLNSIPVAPVAQMGRLILLSQLVDYLDTFHLQRNRWKYQKHHLHEALSVKTPPSNGPTTPEHPNVTPTMPIYAALYCGFAVTAIIINAPLIIPAPPIPLIALPTTTAVEVVAVAQITLPISNTTPASKKLVLRGKYLYAFPHEDRNAVFVSEYALEYQTTSLRLPNSAVMEGMAVDIMVESSAERKMVKMIERVRRMNLRPVTDASFW